MLARWNCKWPRYGSDKYLCRGTRCLRRPPVIAGAVVATGLAWAASTSAAAPTTCHVVSGPRTLPLVELFTSEGCDSCPPADRWLSALFSPLRRPELAGSAVAFAFHVDYWDRLGWRDRFASAQFTQRQRDESRAGGAAFVYTPQVVVQGHDAPGWNRGLAGAVSGGRTPTAARRHCRRRYADGGCAADPRQCDHSGPGAAQERRPVGRLCGQRPRHGRRCRRKPRSNACGTTTSCVRCMDRTRLTPTASDGGADPEVTDGCGHGAQGRGVCAGHDERRRPAGSRIVRLPVKPLEFT